MARYFMGGTRLESFEKMMMAVPNHRDSEEESEEVYSSEKQLNRDEEAEDDIQSETE